ncbi:MAG TPA: thiamine pyrophosphate-requiring protein [Kofleriaceae bacterium]|nr:thiamine pyrophosphate-requiring protein [Kofleriaceae bacterium]
MLPPGHAVRARGELTQEAATMQSASEVFLEALSDAGVAYVFANFGSDHPALLEAFAAAAATGARVPQVITCPAEMVALSAAHGYAQTTGRAQAVVVHVECGTQSLAGAIHNAARGRIPVLIFAGASPFTQEGELAGSRNEFIHWVQDVFDQRGIVRGYVKYENELRTGRNIPQIVHRALQIAHSDPRGPVYLVGPREVMEERVPAPSPEAVQRAARFPPIAPPALAPDDVAQLTEALVRAHRPLVVTSYLGRNPDAPAALVQLCRRLGVGVLESAPTYVNVPTDDPLYVGNQWNEQHPNPVLGAADVILVVDSDVPWIPTVNRPRPDAAIYHVDVDPLKLGMPLWHIPARRAFCADARTALAQLDAHARAIELPGAAIAERTAHYTALHARRQAELSARERADGDVITPEYLTARVRRLIDADTIVLSEGISSYQTINNHLGLTRPGSLLSSGGASLGWHGGAAIGVKLAHPDSTVIALTGDGSYLFSIPSAVHWMARRYQTPFLQIIYDNAGWKSPKLSMLALHPGGHGSRAADLGVGFAPAPDHAGIAAAAGGAFARQVTRAGELDDALDAALDAVRGERRCAVLDVKLPPL